MFRNFAKGILLSSQEQVTNVTFRKFLSRIPNDVGASACRRWQAISPPLTLRLIKVTFYRSLEMYTIASRLRNTFLVPLLVACPPPKVRAITRPRIRSVHCLVLPQFPKWESFLIWNSTSAPPFIISFRTPYMLISL